MPSPHLKKIIVIGNIAGGKTRLSLLLAARYELPLLHVDSIQFQKGMKIRPATETTQIINAMTSQEAWLIDGYGPLEILEQRFLMADAIVLIDLPLWQHYWWLCKRQITNFWNPRKELPIECDERTWEHTKKLFKTIRQMHTKMRPELLKILNREHLKSKTFVVANRREWSILAKQGLPCR